MLELHGAQAVREAFRYPSFQLLSTPSRPDFLLRSGELLQACEGLRIVAYEDGFLSGPDRYVQRVAAVQPLPGEWGRPLRPAAR